MIIIGSSENNPEYQITTPADQVVSIRDTSDKAIAKLSTDFQNDVVTKAHTELTVSLEITTEIKNGSDVVEIPCIVTMTTLIMMWLLSCNMSYSDLE